MNRKIDIAAALIIYLTLCFAVCLAATGSLPVAMLAAYLAGVLARAARVGWQRRVGRKRGERKSRLSRARALVDEWACRPDEAKAREYVSRVYDISKSDFVLLPRHAASPPLDANGILDVWRRFQGSDGLIIAATGAVEEKAEVVSRELTRPKVCVMDAGRLARVIAKSPLDIPLIEPRKRKRLARFHIERKNAPRTALCAVSTLLLYYATGKIIYLLSALALLFVSGLGFIRKPAPKGLFEQ